MVIIFMMLSYAFRTTLDPVILDRQFVNASDQNVERKMRRSEMTEMHFLRAVSG
jgi:hypothetical protein